MEIESLNMADVFVQGTFLFLCLVTGLFFVFRDNLEDYKSVDKVKSLSGSVSKFLVALASLFKLKLTFPTLFGKKNDATKSDTAKADTVNQNQDDASKDNKASAKKEPEFNILSLLPLVVITIFIVGILGKGVANEWMDSDHKNHFYLKSLWAKSILKKGEIKIDNPLYIHDFRELIRKTSFERVFDKKNVDSRIYNQLFYNAKHEIMDVSRGAASGGSKNNHIYSKYVKESQKLAEYSRVFALGFFFVMTCAFLNFWMMMVRFCWKDEDEDDGNNNNNQSKPKAQEGNPPPKKKGKRFTAPDGIIFIFLVFSALFIWFFLNPNFRSYSTSIPTMVAVVVIIFFGILMSTIAFIPRFKKIKFTFFIYSIVYLISISGYFISSKSWLFAEEEATLKILGTFKTKHLTDGVKEVQYMKDELHLNVDYPAFKTQKTDSTQVENKKKDSIN